jgi:2-phosphoglycerate kinase
LNQGLRKQLAHVLWIGGATDSGKSTIAQQLAGRHGMHVYHYDKSDADHLNKLAKTDPEIRDFLNASLDERWIYPEPDALFVFLLHSFPLRFQLVIDDIFALPDDKPVIVEGFGLLPELVHSMISNHHQAIWLVPTDTFKWESMARRGKPSFANMTMDPERAKTNLFTRDKILADYYRKQVSAYGYTLYEVDGSHSVEEMTDLIDEYLAKYLDSLR